MALDTSAIFKENKKGVLFYIKKVLLYMVLLFMAYTLLCFIFIIESNNKTKEANEHFYKKSPDLIAVFTGDMGRIGYTLHKAKEFNESTKIFISGVYSKNSVKTLYNLENESLVNSSIDPNRIEIDYYARNTFENVISTLRYLRKNNGIKEIMVISNDYHIMRIQSLFNKLQAEDSHYQIYYYGIKTNYAGLRNIRILYKEVYKLLRTYVFLMFFDNQDLNGQISTHDQPR